MIAIIKTEENLEYILEQFRGAIEYAKKEQLFAEDFRFKSFPLGCCDDTCDLLGYYLLHTFNFETLQVQGTFYAHDENENTGHAWLVYDHMKRIIDITGDQFKYNSELLYYDQKIYIGEEDDFHKLFDHIRFYPNYDFVANKSKRLEHLYNTILDCL